MLSYYHKRKDGREVTKWMENWQLGEINNSFRVIFTNTLYFHLPLILINSAWLYNSIASYHIQFDEDLRELEFWRGTIHSITMFLETTTLLDFEDICALVLKLLKTIGVNSEYLQIIKYKLWRIFMLQFSKSRNTWCDTALAWPILNGIEWSKMRCFRRNEPFLTSLRSFHDVA